MIRKCISTSRAAVELPRPSFTARFLSASSLHTRYCVKTPDLFEMAVDSGRRTYPLYQYDPSLAATIIFCILFLCTTILHTYQMLMKRVWFLIPLVIGGYCKLTTKIANAVKTNSFLTVESIGYACRTKSATQPHGQYTLMPYVIQNSYILLAPAIFAATIYMILGRVITLTDGNTHSIVSGRKLTWFFLLGDMFCFALQGGGEGLHDCICFRTNGHSRR